MSQRRSGAHGAKKKRNKPHRTHAPRPVEGGLSILLSRATQAARIEGVLSSRYCEEQLNELAGAYWMAFDQLKMGAATEQDWATTAVTLNKAMLLCETGFGEEHIGAMRAALDGMFLAQLRGNKTGTYRLDGAGIRAVSEALDIHDEQMKLVTFRDIRRVEEMFEMRQAAGNVYQPAAA